MTEYVILAMTGYTFGSIPFGVIISWAVRRIDVRDYGSGNTGTTNVLRTVGRPAAVLVLLLDMVKGILPIVLSRMVSDAASVESVAALAALLGHNWPVFLAFRGGRGTAAGWGSLLIISPLSGMVATVLGIAVLGGTRYVSLGSIVATTAGTVTLVGLSLAGQLPLGYIWFGAIGGPLVVLRHKDNIQRLLKGAERKMGQSVQSQEECSDSDRPRDQQ